MEITLSEGASEIGLAVMLRDLIIQNMDQHPHKLTDFKRLRISIGIAVPDVDIALTLKFEDGTLTIQPGLGHGCGLTIRTDAQTLMNLSNQRIRWGLPYYFDETGREIMAAMKRKHLEVKGMIAHFPSLIRFSRLMSVHT